MHAFAGAYFLLTESLTAEQMKAAQDTRKQSPSVLSHSPFSLLSPRFLLLTLLTFLVLVNVGMLARLLSFFPFRRSWTPFGSASEGRSSASSWASSSPTTSSSPCSKAPSPSTTRIDSVSVRGAAPLALPCASSSQVSALIVSSFFLLLAAARQSSYVLCFVALLFAMLQGGGITRLTRRISEARLIVASFFVLSFSLFFWALASSIPLLLLALVPFSLSSGALNTLINSLITKHVKSHEIGGTPHCPTGTHNHRTRTTAHARH